jgi:acyl-coenzyme A synthetase/AMP-(fatty) acid ligase
MTGLPLLDGYAPDDPLLWPAASTERALSAAQFCGAVARLAPALPRARHAINRCDDPARFMLGAAAVLAAGQTLVLPPARAGDVQRQVRAQFPDAYTLVDAAGDEPGAVAVPPMHAAGPACWPPPSIDGAHVAAILFTSGSTGAPTPQPKTWSSLVRGAGTFARSFGPPSRDAVIVGTVAPQHMFGFETTVLAPWQTGIPLAAVRPLFPADVDALLRALAAQHRGAWLLTTPLHLRAFHTGLREAPPLARVIASTMPMAAELAAGLERDRHVPVDEI